MGRACSTHETDYKYSFKIENLVGKGSLWRPRHRWKDSIGSGQGP
jgi:hypothetical protein